MTKSTVTTKISAAFLATVLVAGIIAIASPSFIVGAQAQEYGMEKRYNSYESEPDYGMDRYGSEPDYGMDRYGSEPDYGMDSYEKKAYGSEPDYGMDSYEKKAYGNDDYESKYPSYGKDNSYKSKDNAKDSVSVKKVKCNNVNINLNGAVGGVNGDNGNGDNGNGDNGNGDNGNGDNGNGDNGNGDDNGNGEDLTAASNGYGERNYKKVDTKDGFTFVCINNNNNIGGGNITDGDGDANITEQCEECFDQLSGNVEAFLTAALLEGFEVNGLTVPPGTSIVELCVLLEGANIVFTLTEVLEFIAEVFEDPTQAEIDQIIELLLCLEALGIIDLQINLPIIA